MMQESKNIFCIRPFFKRTEKGITSEITKSYVLIIVLYYDNFICVCKKTKAIQKQYDKRD